MEGGTQAYQQHFETQFGDRPRHISPYVQMEIWRSYLRNIIEFHFTLRLPTIPTLSDALTFGSNKHQTSKHKFPETLAEYWGITWSKRVWYANHHLPTSHSLTQSGVPA